MSPSDHVCPKCGAVLPSNAAEGLCPRCLFAQLTDPPAPEGGEAEAEGSHAVPAAPEGGSQREFGDYELFEEIGEGGMGVVYRARQVSLNRPVAVKVIKPGMDTRKIIARFEAERQALALMDHPNIAKIFDAGTTDPHPQPLSHPMGEGGQRPGEGSATCHSSPATHSGRPYFVMELVKGIPITKFCEEWQLDLGARLKLFIQVCQAVQHAHQKGIIHRDLKPSNILVTELDGRPVPKIIDFGIAKATEGHLTGETLFTVAGQFLGTPAYLSPEQAEWGGVDIDTRSDIYSLGVLLYELLTGCLPFEPKTLARAGLEEMRRTIREVTPVRPSTRLRQTSSVSGPASAPVTRHLPLATDLDWIAMKCLEKDRARRYETANGLAEDLRRHLDNEPVLARPPSRIYEFQKTVRRHKIGFAATATVILVLIAGVLASTWEATRATRAERQALAERRQAQAQEFAARRRAYVADMRTLGESLEHNLARARSLLNDYRPRPGQEDLRDFEWYYFKHVLSEDESTVLGTHPGGAMTLLTEPDGTFITAGQARNWASAAGDLQIWDGLEGKLKSSFNLPEDAIGIALSHDGKRLAIAHRDLDIELRSMDQPDRVQTVLTNWHRGLRHNAWTMAMCFVDDDTQLAVGDWSINWSKTSLPLTFVQIASDRANQSLPFVPPLGLNGLAVSRDGRRLAVKESSGRIIVLDFPGAKPVCSIETQDTWWLGVYPAMTFLNDSDFLVTTSNSGQIDVWNLTTTNRVRTIGNHGGFVSAVALSSDGKRLASVGLNQLVKVWDPQVKRSPVRVFRGHTDQIFGVGFLPDSHTLVSCGRDQTVRRWDLRRPNPDEGRWRLPPGQKQAFINSGLLVATDSLKVGEGWKIWDVSSLSEPLEPRPISPPPSLKGAFVAPLLGTPYHLVWPDLSTLPWARMRLYQGLNPPEPVAGFPEIGTRGDICVQFRNPLLMIHGAIRGEPYDLVWDLTRSRKVHLVKSPMLEVTAVAFASDGSFVILGDGYRFEKLDLTTGVSDEWDAAAPPMLSSLAVLPENRTVLAAGGLGVLRKLDFSTRQTNSVIGSQMAFQCMCLSPSGTRLATGDLGGNVRLWDVETLREVALLGTHPGRVMGLYFTPDGRNLLSVDATELRVWRTAEH